MKKLNRTVSIILSLALVLGCVFPMSLISTFADTTSTEYDKLVSFDPTNLDAASGESVKATMNSGASYSGQASATIVKMTDDGNYYRGVLTANGSGSDTHNVVAQTDINSSTEGYEWMANASTLSALSPYLVYTLDYRVTGLDGATVPSDGKLYVNAAKKSTGRAFNLFSINMTGAASWNSVTLTNLSREAVAWTDGYLGFSIYSNSKSFNGSYQFDIRNFTISLNPEYKAVINEVLSTVGSSYTYGTLTGTDDEEVVIPDDTTGTIGNWGTDASNHSEDYDESILLRDTDNNNFVMTLTEATTFSLEADITFSNGKSAGFVFNSTQATGASNWIGVVCNGSSVRLYHSNQTYLDISAAVPEGAIVDNKFHLKLEGGEGGIIKVYMGDSTEPLISTTSSRYTGGYIGLLTYNSSAAFENIVFTDSEGTAGDIGFITTGSYETRKVNRSVTVKDTDKNNFVISDSSSSDFTLEADVTFINGNCAGFVFGNTISTAPSKWLAVHVSKTTVRLFDNDHNSSNKINTTVDMPEGALSGSTVHLKLDVASNGTMKVYTSVSDTLVIETQTTWNGGYVGLMTYNCSAKYENITYVDRNVEVPEGTVLGSFPSANTSNYTDKGSGADRVITVANKSSNNFIISDTTAKNFTLEADVTLTSGNCAGFLFGNAVTTGANKWLAVHVSKTTVRLFDNDHNSTNKIDVKVNLPDGAFSGSTVHLKLDVDANGTMKVYTSGSDTPVIETSTTWRGGYVGFMTYCCSATFENISFCNEDIAPTGFHTNLENLSGKSGYWTEGYTGFGGENGQHLGNVYAMSETQVCNDNPWVYTANVTLNNADSMGGIVFGAANAETLENNTYYVANVDKYHHADGRVSIYKSGSDSNVSQGAALTTAQLTQSNYTIRVEYDGSDLTLYLDNSKVAALAADNFSGGYVGLVSKNADVIFDDVYYYESTQNYELTDVNVENATMDSLFAVGDDNFYATAIEGATSVSVTPYAEDGTVIYVNGTKTTSGSSVNVSLKSTVGYNCITIKTQSAEGYFAKEVYLYVLKAADDITLYDTDVRPQNHFSVPYGYLNDPNGLLYNAKSGEYHMFYQAYNISQSPSDAKQWAHAVSTDLVHWEDYPTALHADDYWMWSGNGVIDYNNTAGLYDESTDPAERMVLVYTTRESDFAKINLAYTTDGGVTWEKYNNGRPLENGMGQDPDVFWYEDATMENGGIWIGLDTGNMYTSPNLKEWTYNSKLKYNNGDTIGWECPDMYRIKVEGTDEYKWIYSGGGSYYLIGDIVKDENGVFSFVPEKNRLIYNGDAYVYNTAFSISGLTSGKNGSLYATQHFYAAPDDRIINISWMRQNYGKLDSTGIWHGAMSVPMETKLIDTVDGLRLTSYPVEEYDVSRGEKIYSETNVEVTPDSENILSTIEGSVLDFEGVFTPDENVTEFGFKLRVSESGENYITVKYDTVNNKLYADFANSGDAKYIHSRNMPVTQLEDGKVKVRLLLDRTILDVFVNDGLAPLSTTYMCDAANIGVEFYTVGGNVTVDSMDIYEVNPYWKDIFSAEDLAALRKILLGCDDVKYYVEDFNGDNKVDIKDLVRLKKILTSYGKE